MTDKLVKAEWVAGLVTELPDGTILAPGVVTFVPAGEAAASDNWRPLKAKAPEAEKGGDA